MMAFFDSLCMWRNTVVQSSQPIAQNLAGQIAGQNAGQNANILPNIRAISSFIP
jgi:hypothetical protein